MKFYPIGKSEAIGVNETADYCYDITDKITDTVFYKCYTWNVDITSCC